MRPVRNLFAIVTSWMVMTATDAPGQTAGADISSASGNEKTLVVTGARFAYPLLQQWILDYKQVRSDVSISIAPRGTSDPRQYDILIEVYDPGDQSAGNRDYTFIARYPVLIVAHEKSVFARRYMEKGLTGKLIRHIFFHDLFNEKTEVTAPYTIYTRLQRAGAPIVFTRHFGYEQKDIKGKTVAGSDEHLLRAIQRDSTALSYLPLPLVYDPGTGQPRSGLVVIPTDLNDNNKVGEDERFYDNLSHVIRRLEKETRVHNLPVGTLHLSVDRAATHEARAFIEWVKSNGASALHEHGFLQIAEPDPTQQENQTNTKTNNR